jgi:hypothetical protein
MSQTLLHCQRASIALDGVICIPSPTVHSFDMVDFISAEFPERVGEEDVCYLQNEMVKVNFLLALSLRYTQSFPAYHLSLKVLPDHQVDTSSFSQGCSPAG